MTARYAHWPVEVSFHAIMRWQERIGPAPAATSAACCAS
jgi:hypothetical protein